ncbi:MAG: hypothetical protein CBC03_16140 [Pseudoalteromonas sp. TMED43]|nr:MAG: hypothetical protein CBC03_16140 [Pseudoalteromonas sp. TMED43]
MRLNHFAGLNVLLPALQNAHSEQLNSDLLAKLSTRFSSLKIDYLINRIGITLSVTGRFRVILLIWGAF